MKRKVNQEDLINQNIKISELETSNRILLEKLNLLKIQLESQSQLQFSAYHFHKSAPTHRSHMNLFHRNYNSNGFQIDDSSKTAARKQYESLLQQLHNLQVELENVKKQNRIRILELEEQLATTQSSISPNKLKTELDDNVELIKLKRLTKKQSAQILSLQSQLDISTSEIKQLQSDLSDIASKNENLQAELSAEKSEITKLLSSIATLSEGGKFLEDQLKDLQAEKSALKEHNENLLKLSLKRDSTIGVSDNSRSSYLKQIKELEENFKREVVAKSEAITKLADTEILNVKLQNELTKNTSIISEMKTNNGFLKEEIESLRHKLEYETSKISEKPSHFISTCDKSVMTITPENGEVTNTKHLENLPILGGAEEGIDNVKIQLYKMSNELHQCKELLRVQYGLNNKYKMDIEELQKIFQKNEKTYVDCLKNFQNLFKTQKERFSQIRLKPDNYEIIFNPITNHLNNISKSSKLTFQDYINALDRLLHYYSGVLENVYQKAEDTRLQKRNVLISASIETDDKYVQIDEDLSKLGDEGKNKSDGEYMEEKSEESAGISSVQFELHISTADFSYCSEHLMKSTDKNPRIFLTWNFLNDNEHQAYTPTISMNENTFNCSCQYEGPWSPFLHHYLSEFGIRVEMHLVQGDISVRIAEGIIDTSTSVENPNKQLQFQVNFENDNINASVRGNYIFKCNKELITYIQTQKGRIA